VNTSKTDGSSDILSVITMNISSFMSMFVNVFWEDANASAIVVTLNNKHTLL
jgi:hypothetical protein